MARLFGEPGRFNRSVCGPNSIPADLSGQGSGPTIRLRFEIRDNGNARYTAIGGPRPADSKINCPVIRYQLRDFECPALGQPTGSFVAASHAGMNSKLATNKGVQDGQRQRKRQRRHQGRQRWFHWWCQGRKAGRQSQLAEQDRQAFGWRQGQQSSEVKIVSRAASRMCGLT